MHLEFPHRERQLQPDDQRPQLQPAAGVEQRPLRLRIAQLTACGAAEGGRVAPPQLHNFTTSPDPSSHIGSADRPVMNRHMPPCKPCGFMLPPGVSTADENVLGAYGSVRGRDRRTTQKSSALAR